MGQVKTSSLNRTILLLIGLLTALIISANAQKSDQPRDSENTVEEAYQLIYNLVHKP